MLEQLSASDLLIASVLMLALSGLSFTMKLGLEKTIAIAACRTVIQLLIIGWVLKFVFAQSSPIWMICIGSIMLLMAGREVMSRQNKSLNRKLGYYVGTLSMFCSSFSLTVFALVAVIRPDPWYAPQYAIPLLGMMLGNTMTGVALTIDRMTQMTKDGRWLIEQRLALGEKGVDAISEFRAKSIRSGLIPIINSMAAAGIVSLPGMMTGQILAGADVLNAVMYQILIMFLVSSGTGFGVFIAIRILSKSLFDERDRLCLKRWFQEA